MSQSLILSDHSRLAPNRKFALRAVIRRAARAAIETLEERLLFSTLIVNSTADNISDTSVLTLRDAVGLVNSAGDPTALGQATMPTGWASQITGTFGTNDTIVFDSTVFPSGSLTTITLGGSPLQFTNTASPVTVSRAGCESSRN